MKKKVRQHIIFWSVYFLFEINAEIAYLQEVFKDISWQKNLYFSTISELTFLAAEIPAFYIILLIIDGKTKLLKSVLIKTIAIVFNIILFTLFYRILCHDLIYPLYYGVPEDIDRFSQSGFFSAFMNIVFAVALGFGFEKFHQQNEVQKKLAELSKEKLESEIKFLKTQINPHFLFNTLNNIYGLSLKKADETPEIILKLAKIMRYNIYDSAKNSVPISNEIENIQDFIDVQKIRHKSVKVEFYHILDDNSLEISPLILLQFVENAFKHGVSESRFDSFIKIYLELKDQVLIFRIENSKELEADKNSTKIGLQNIKRQLELLYRKHHLEILDQNNSYKVTLQILLN